MAAAWVSQYSPEHTQQFAINLLSEEDFFNFDMFREDLSQDLNFLFSESPEIPAASNEAADTMAIASQLPANPFEFNTEPSAVLKLTKLPSSNLGKCFRRLLVRASTTLTVFTIDMNEPTVLGLYTQLFMSQQDSTKKEFVFCSPDHFIQGPLHSLARKLGLEYEHSLRPSQVRISKPPHASYSELGRLGYIKSQGTFYSSSASERTGMQVAQSKSPVTGSFEATKLRPNENAFLGVASVGLLEKATMDLERDSRQNPYIQKRIYRT
jgi:hypothetical protein